MVEVISFSGTFASVKLISRDSRSAKTEENMTGWWFQPSEKYEFVSWDYYSQYMEK